MHKSPMCFHKRTFDTLPLEMELHRKWSLFGYTMFNIGLYLFHLPNNWLYFVILILFSSALTWHHLYDPYYIHFEKWAMLFVVVFLEIFLYFYLFHLDVMYKKIAFYIPDVPKNNKLIAMYIVSVQLTLLSSIIIIFASAWQTTKKFKERKLYLI
eukprot:NODE_134_length_16603_cov_0.784052.p13 type:complete len:155 gc:universal NODE_134_length_16603_cov_0.784052:14933-14469(-)